MMDQDACSFMIVEVAPADAPGDPEAAAPTPLPRAEVVVVEPRGDEVGGGGVARETLLPR